MKTVYLLKEKFSLVIQFLKLVVTFVESLALYFYALSVIRLVTGKMSQTH